MISKRIKDNILKYIDGNLDPGLIEKMETLMKENSEAEAFYQKMLKLDNMLKKDKQKSEKVDLSDGIMDEILEMERLQERSVGQGWLAKLFPNTGWNVAYALVLGIIIGFFVFSPVLRPKTDTFNIDEIGTLYDVNAQHAFNLPINLEDVNAEINVHNLSEDFVQIVVQMSSEENAKMRFSFNKSSISIWSFRPLSQNMDCKVLTGYNSLEIMNTGDNTYIILLKMLSELEEQVKVEVFSNDAHLYETILEIKN